jgi:hypothetical protein
MDSYNVLFLCTGNSARSIMAEALLNYWGKGRFRAFSAGSFPKGEVHPLAIATLERNRLPTNQLRSKSWNEFSSPDAPPMPGPQCPSNEAAGWSVFRSTRFWSCYPAGVRMRSAHEAVTNKPDAEKFLSHS